MTIDFTRRLNAPIHLASPEIREAGKRIRAEIQRRYGRIAGEVSCAIQDRKYGAKANSLRPGRGDLHIKAADEREDEAWAYWDVLSVAYHKWDGSASGRDFEGPITAEEAALLRRVASLEA